MHPEYKDTKPSLLIKAALDLIHEPGDTFEIRIPKTKAGTISGYFNDTAKAAVLAARENGKHQAIYVTANPVRSELLARSENKLAISQQTTTDSEISRRRWFLLDLDPIRPAGISSTEGELTLARIKANEIVEWLSSIGWPLPLQACSGNGWHVMYRIDLPNDNDSRVNVEFALKMLSTIFSDQTVAVDVTSFNASRVWKLYGTISAKGSSTYDRPHRVAMLQSIPKELVLVTSEQLENVARPLRDAKPEEYKDMAGEYIADMVKWLTDRGQTVTSGPRPMFGNEGQKWTISRCPFDHSHQNPMVGLVNHRPVFRCLHNSCSAYKWKEFREKIDPTYKDPDTIQKRLQEWIDSDSEEIDPELVQSASATGNQLNGIIKRIKKDAPRARVLLLENHLKEERRRFIRETIGENNEKGNLVGLINRTRAYQSEGIVPMYWIADYDHRIRVGKVGDIDCPKLSESDEIGLLIKFHTAGDTWVKQTHTAQVIKHLAESYRVNPLRVFLKQKRWDGTKRLSSWLPNYCGTADNLYTQAVGRKWFISAVARAMDPGCQADHMLILEGKQGIGKSRALRIIGGQFYTEYSGSVKSGMSTQKDLVHVIIGKMIVEMSELAAIRKADMESLKAMLTTCVDDARLSYERDARAYPRTCVFAGTTNAEGQSYIADQSGARRFWPVLAGEVQPMRTDLLQQDIDQLWAEAVEAYESGEDWYTVPQDLVSAEQTDRQILLEDSEPWFGKIRSALTDPENFNEIWYARDEYDKGLLTGGFILRAAPIHVILGVIIGVDTAKQTPFDVERVGRVLRGIGFKKVRPSQKWHGSSYAYDLSESAIPHLWPAIRAAKDAVPFPKSKSREKNEG